MPRIMRRTPATEEAMDYGYRNFLQDAIGKVREGASRNVERFLTGEVGNEEMLGMALAGVGGTVKMSGASKAVRGLLKSFQKQGLKYDALAEPIPGSPQYNYHQWTLYGEGPAKGATFGTKTTESGEMTEKIAELMKRFSKK